ncbi:MAG: efflux RND transporter periplasmic adaptor subunit [bacterium]
MLARPRPVILRPLGLLLLSLPVLALGGCGKGSPAGAAAADPPGGPKSEGKPAPVAVEPVHLGDASNYYTATASLEPENVATILARTTGVVREILHEEGDHVAKGELLLRLEDDEAQLRVKQAEANAAAAHAEHERKSSMRDAGLLSAGEFETIENTMRVRDVELGLAKLALDYTHVAAPFAGRVTRRLVNPGANVSPGVQLFELMDDEPMLARVHVPARRMGSVAPGQRIAIRLDSANLDLEGVVTLVSPIVDETTGTVKVTAEVRNHPPGIRPGDFAEVKIVTERHSDAKLVPSRAIVEDEGDSIVYVIANGKATRRVVKPGFVEGDTTEILSGLAKDELICVKGQRDLRDGQAVEVLEGPGAPATAQTATKAAAKTT